MKINFVSINAVCFRYFIPIINEAVKRGHEPSVYLMKGNKYCDNYLNIGQIQNLSSQFKFAIKDEKDIRLANGVFFLIEGVGLNFLSRSTLKISLTAMTDFRFLYDKYIDLVDRVIFPSKFFAEHYGKISDKNLYLGSPKYDVEFDEDKIRNKYKLYKDKCALVLYPKVLESKKIDLLKIYGLLKEMGYFVIVKSRGKDSASEKFRGDKYLEDYTWYPHTTMELMHISDLVVNFDSTAIKESIMLGRPILNFNIKFNKNPLDFLYDNKVAIQMPLVFQDKLFKDRVDALTQNDHLKQFSEIKSKYLFNGGSVSSKILDLVTSIV